MDNSQLVIFVAFLGCLGTGATLVITIAGWLVTAYFQKNILDRQIEAEKTRDTRHLVVPERLDRLRKLRAWFEEGSRFIAIGNNVLKLEGERIKYREWLVQGFGQQTFAANIEGKSVADTNDESDDLAQMVDVFGDLVDECVHKGGVGNKVSVYDRALKRIDLLEQQIAEGSSQDKNATEQRN